MKYFKILFVLFLFINTIFLYGQNNKLFTIDKSNLKKGQTYTISKNGIDYSYKINETDKLEIFEVNTKQEVTTFTSLKKRDVPPNELCVLVKKREDEEFFNSDEYRFKKQKANETCIPQKICNEDAITCNSNDPYRIIRMPAMFEVLPDPENVNCNPVSRKCLMKDIKADFYLEQTKTNGETIVINTVPKTTSGVEHYWGIVGNGKAPNCNCACEDISLDDIKNAKTTGVWATRIKADGTFENIGIGTNVTAGTSGLGIKYGGFPYYGCYKITHYIICDNRIESYTTCVGQSPNN